MESLKEYIENGGEIERAEHREKLYFKITPYSLYIQNVLESTFIQVLRKAEVLICTSMLTR